MSKELFFKEREDEHLMDDLLIEADMIEKQREYLDEFLAPLETGTLIWSSKKQRNRWRVFPSRNKAKTVKR